jgi:hypothetical protein
VKTAAKVGIGIAVVAAATAIYVGTASASPAAASDLEVSRDCSRLTVKSRAGLTAKVGLAVWAESPKPETRVIDLLAAVLKRLVPQCAWPPPGDTVFAGLSEFRAPVEAVTWDELVEKVGELTWGEAKSMGALDFAPVGGASPPQLAAGVALLAALGWGA